MAKDMLGQKLELNDLIAWGHSGRYAGTRIGRVYKVEKGGYVRAWIFDKVDSDYMVKLTGKTKGEWVRGNHAGPLNPVKLAEVAGAPPLLDEAQLKR